MELSHASFFSGIGGLDLGLERAGWRTVSHSEIDPYASAVLAHHWPGVPQLGDIVALADAESRGPAQSVRRAGRHRPDPAGWRSATLWSGGFPCQDLSIAGKRSGFEGDRSSLAFIFLDLVERYRPRAVLLENVPGLLSSHAGRDMARLLGEMAELGYGVAWRSLDAQHFGVPQRRQRVFIVGLRSGADDPDGHLAAIRAAEVLAVGTRCGGHPPQGSPKGPEVARGPRTGLEIAGTYTAGAHPGSYNGQDAYTGHIITGTLREHVRPGSNTDHTIIQRPADEREGGDGRDGSEPDDLTEPDGRGQGRSAGSRGLVGPTSDTGRDGAPDGPAGRLDDRPGLATYYLAPEIGQGADLTAHEVTLAPAITPTEYERSTDRGVRVTSFVKRRRSQSTEDPESWEAGGVAPTVNVFDTGDTRATTLVHGAYYDGLNQKLDGSGIYRSIRVGRDSSDFVVADENTGDTTLVGALRANSGGWRPRAEEHPDMTIGLLTGEEDPLLPLGLDSNRYRACGNAVVSNVAEWLGWRLRQALEDE